MPGHIKLTVERKVSASVSSGSTPEPWESSTTDSTVTGRNSTDGGMEPLGNRVVEVTLAQHNERKLSTTVTAEATLSPVEPVDAQNVIEQMRNPVLDRITGGGNSKLRYEIAKCIHICHHVFYEENTTYILVHRITS